MTRDRFEQDGPDGDAGAPGAQGDAQDVLRGLDVVRARFGGRLAAPWWYRAAAALVVAALFAGAGMPYESISLGSSSVGAGIVVLAAVMGPIALRHLLKRSTRAAFDRYADGWLTPSVALIALLVACLGLQAFADADLAPVVGAVVGAVVTYLAEGRIDRRLARGEFRTARPGLA